MDAMSVGICSAAAQVMITFKVGWVMTEPDGTVAICGSAPDGALYTVEIRGVDLAGLTFRQILDAQERPDDPDV